MGIDAEAPSPGPSPNVRAATYYIARRRTCCPHCHASTQLAAVALAPAHELLDDESQNWQAVPVSAFLFHLEALSISVQARLRRAAPGFCFESCWVNRCQHCARILADDELHGEPGRGFTPLDEAEAANIFLTEIAEPFEASAAGYTLDPAFFDQMRRA